MKTFIALVLGALFLSTALLPSQTTDAPGRTPSRIAFVNMAHVLKRYSKAIHFKSEMQADVAAVKKDLDESQKNIGALRKQHDEPLTSPEQKANIEALIGDESARRKKAEYDLKKRVADAKEKQLVELYGDVDAMCKRFAKKNGFNAVLCYGDVEVEEFFRFENVERRLKGMDLGALCPVYVDPEFDVTDRMTADLNKEHGTRK